MIKVVIFSVLIILASGEFGKRPSLLESKDLPETFILLTGGANDHAGGLYTVELFPPSPPCGPLMPPLDIGRLAHTTFTHEGQILSCGGMDNPTCAKLDLGTLSWRYHSHLTTQDRLYASYGAINGQPCIIGGLSDAAHSMECLSDNTWSLLQEPIPGGGVYSSCAAQTLGGGILIIGGYYARTQVIERLSSGTWDTSSWTQLSSGKSAHSCSLYDSNTKLMVTGGQHGSSGVTSTLIIDMTSKNIYSGPEMQQGRYGHVTATLGDMIYVLGGWGDRRLLSVEVFEETSGVWTKLEDTLLEEKSAMGYTYVSPSSLGC